MQYPPYHIDTSLRSQKKSCAYPAILDIVSPHGTTSMKRRGQAFTIVELIVVVAIIGILATIAVLSFSRFQAQARDTQRASRVSVLAELLEKYYDAHGEYPSCPVMSGPAAVLTTTVLPGLEPNTLLTPKSIAGTTNSVSCIDLTGANGEPDSFAYVGDSSTDCTSGQTCLQWILKYREEGTGTIISTSSRRRINLATSGTPVLNALPAGFSQVNLTWSIVANAGGYSLQYATNSSFTTNLVTQSVASTSLPVPGLTTGTTYYFRVRAVNGSSIGNWSNIQTIVVNFTNIAWTEHTAPGLDYWTSAASSADGNKLIAGTTYYGGYLHTSTDAGATWTTRTSAGNLGWGSAASSADGAKLVAAPNNGYIYSSTDSGATWTALSAGGSRQWWGLAMSADGTKLIGSASFGGYIYTSSDSGATWTEHSSVGLRDWQGVTVSDDGTKLAGVSRDGYIYTSVDSGATWASRTTVPGSLTWWCVRSSSDGTKLIASASVDNYLYMSTDSGATWTASKGAGSRNWRQVAMSGDGIKLAAAAWGDYIYTSVDSGATWVAQTTAGSKFWLVIDSSTDGSKLFSGVSSMGYLYNGVYGP